MLRTHNCGELRIEDLNKVVILTGWVLRTRDKGSLLWIDLRDRYGITQLFLEKEKSDSSLLVTARELGREFVVRATGTVIKRKSANEKLSTGQIEIKLESLQILNISKTPPFTIEDNTDGGDDLRMKYRYLDLRRTPIRENLILRHRLAQQTRAYLDSLNFIEVETPILIKSTPEGARDYVVPSRLHHGDFYALPQSPQTFKQLLMIAGFDRYYQIVKCFRDEDLRADRQPEFTQIDCEMSFISQEDILSTFEGLIRHLFSCVKGLDLPPLPRITYDDAIKYYGTDKPDIRFEMKFTELTSIVKGKGCSIFDDADIVVGISATGCASFTRKQIDELTKFVRQPQIDAQGLVWVRYNTDGQTKSSVDKFYSEKDINKWISEANANPGDLLLILAGEKTKTRKALGELRLKMGELLGLRNPDSYSALWVTDFPLLEWDEESKCFHAMHHPFTLPKHDDIEMLETNPSQVRADAYDMVINGTEVGGGSIRIHDRKTQELMLNKLGFTELEAKKQFGFLMDAFEFGAPPHGGIAFGFDRICALFGGSDSIRDFIAFPKNNAGRDVMIDSPSTLASDKLTELGLENKR